MEDQINYSLSTSVIEDILEIVIKGDLTKKDIDLLHADVLKILKEKDYKALLCDIREAKGPLDISDAYFRTRSIPPEIIKMPAALVFKFELVGKDYQSFYETTTANVGQSLKWFTKIEDARAWLRSMIKKF